MATLWHNATLVTMREGQYHRLPHGAMLTKNGRIIAVDTYDNIDKEKVTTTHDLKGAWVTPSFIDTHTHLVFGGNRSEEFEKRLEGVSYSEIAKAGGGIISTVNATKIESIDSLYQSARWRITQLIKEGTTVVEVKSGYGLDLETELKMLEVIRQLKETLPITIKMTYLAAHALPKEYNGNHEAYIDYVIHQALPEIVKVCKPDAIDGFCEHIAFSTEDIKRLFEAAKHYDIPIKLHAEQLSSMHGSTLAAEYGALSADHLEYAEESDVVAMAKAGTVAVLLPGAFYTLKETQLPPVQLFRDHQVKMALATDLNPGTSPLLSIRLAMNMGCTLFGLTPEEALAGVTYNAAYALGLEKEFGSLEEGKSADFIIWDINHVAELAYWIGGILPHQTIVKGQPLALDAL